MLPRVLKRPTAALAAAVVGVLVACSGGDDSGRAETIDTTAPASSPATSQTSIAPLATSVDDVVLTLEDMPPGYSPRPSEDEDDEPTPPCEGVPATDVEPIEEATSEFSAGQTGPFIASAAGSYPDAATANGQLDYLVGAIADCGNTIEIVADDGSTNTATLTPLSFNQVGDRTIAFRATIDDGPVPVSFDQITAQADNVVILLTYVTALGDQPDAALAEELLQTMVDRVA